MKRIGAPARRDRREGPSSLRRAVELREDDPGQPDRLVERLGAPAGGLAHRGVEDEERLVGLQHRPHPLQLLDELGVDPAPPGGVDDDREVGRELGERLPDDDLRSHLAAVRVELAADLDRELLELVDRRRAVDVGRDQTDADPLLLKIAGELSGGRRLALAEQSRQKDPPGLDLKWPIFPEDPPDLLVDDPHQEVPQARAGRRFLLGGPLAYALGEVEAQLDVDIRLEQRPLDVADDLGQQSLVHDRARGRSSEAPRGAIFRGNRAPWTCTVCRGPTLPKESRRYMSRTVTANGRGTQASYRTNGLVAWVSMTADAPPAPKPPPPKLNPVRVTIVEEPVAERTTDFREVLHPTARRTRSWRPSGASSAAGPGVWKRARSRRTPGTTSARSPTRDFDGAAKVTLNENPLATSLCKVCYHYCEDACVVEEEGRPDRDPALEAGLPRVRPQRPCLRSLEAQEPAGRCVGAGPAGMMAAWELGVRGYSVTVFEEENGTAASCRPSRRTG